MAEATVGAATTMAQPGSTPRTESHKSHKHGRVQTSLNWKMESKRSQNRGVHGIVEYLDPTQPEPTATGRHTRGSDRGVATSADGSC